MGFLDRLLGREPQPSARPDYGTPESGGWSRETHPGPARQPGVDSDEAAIERYRYLLRTAPPDAVEQAHREAFSQLTPEQRRQVLTQLGSQVPESERATSDDPQSLARMATRAEMRRPGTLERSFGGAGGMGGGIGVGGLIAGSLLASVAGAFVGTAIADAMFDASDSQGSDSADGGDSGDSSAEDPGGAESADSGGGFDAAGDFGGGDFGDFGGGDF